MSRKKKEYSADDYRKTSFLIIDEDESAKTIHDFCDAVFVQELQENSGTEQENKQIEMMEDEGSAISGKDFLIRFLMNLPKPITIVQEVYHIDRSFRDTYYMYFSNQHFQIERHSRRLSLFLGAYNRRKFLGRGESICCELEKNFVGCFVINPLIVGSIGRTLIDPKFALQDTDMPAYMRLSTFSVHIYGRTLNVRAFPYRMQDQETMCCAEVTLLNLLEYYSNSYSDYKAVLPNEIIEKEREFGFERVLPSRGITYPVLTKVLSEFGFSPRLYHISAIDDFEYSPVRRKDELRRWLHYYIESGIPVAIGLGSIEPGESGHSMVCIGHGKAKEQLKKLAYKNRWISWENKDQAHPIINSADFYDDYVVVDDNQPIYQVRNFQDLSVYPNMRVENLAVPLYKRMFLDAPDAISTIRSVLNDERLGLNAWANDFLDKGESVVVRMFMASSRSYKAFRMRTLSALAVKELYTLIAMPRFIWVCELYRVGDYDKLMAFGEIVIDATSAPNRSHQSLILMHYPKRVAYREPNQTEAGFGKMAKIRKDNLFPGYRRNLDKIDKG